jgi:hypothetical protein
MLNSIAKGTPHGMATKLRNRPDCSLSVEVDMSGGPTQLRALVKHLSPLVGGDRAASAMKKAAKSPVEKRARASVASLLQALHPTTEDAFTALQDGKPAKRVKNGLFQHWGGLPHAAIPQAFVWELGERGISLEIPAIGELGAAMLAASAAHPDLLFSCSYTFLDSRTGEKHFDVPIRIARSRYRNGQLEGTMEWRA